MSDLEHLMQAALNLAELGAQISAKAWGGDLAVTYKPMARH